MLLRRVLCNLTQSTEIEPDWAGLVEPEVIPRGSKKKKGKKLLDYFCNERPRNLAIATSDECLFSFAISISASLRVCYEPNRVPLDISRPILPNMREYIWISFSSESK